MRRRSRSRWSSQGVRICLESLEPRRLLDGRIVISELVASNAEGLEDNEGDRGDWIELFNAGDAPVDLAGWSITDDPEDARQWVFPQTTIDVDQYLVVFASGKDRRVPGEPLHTSFRLSRNGEYLGLIEPNGTIHTEMAPSFPAMLPDVAYGVAQASDVLRLVAEDNPVRVLIPTVENGGDQLARDAWTVPEFDDSTWLPGTAPVGLEGGTAFLETINFDVRAIMQRVNSTAYLRLPFQAPPTSGFFGMTLRVKYDDGYVAFLNGEEIARRNAPAELTWEARATGRPSDEESLTFEDVDVSEYLHLLREGDNTLAIQGMNSSAGSNDFLIGAELLVLSPVPIADARYGFFAEPSPGASNGLDQFSGLVQPVTTSVERGFFEEPLSVTVSTPTRGASLVYTTDGSLPARDNGTVVAPVDGLTVPAVTLTIDRTTTLRTAAFLDGFLTSDVNTQTYLMPEDIVAQDFQATLDAGFPATWGRRETAPDYGMDPRVVGPNDAFDGRFADAANESLRSVPTVSIVTDVGSLFDTDTGIYANSLQSGSDWERAVSVEVFDDAGEFNYQADAGLRIAGDNVRNFDNSKKQSFRLEFRADYGPRKMRIPLFGADATDSLDAVVLRGAYNDGWVHTPTTTQYIRDTWARETLLEMGRPQAHGIFVHVYLNGIYWGLYNAVERPNAAFASEYFAGEEEEWDALNTGQVRDGDRSAWSRLLTDVRPVRTSDVAESNRALLALVGRKEDGSNDPERENLLDVDQFIDYMIVNHYGGNVDWPGRNYYAARQRGPESTGFKYFAWDTEKILNHGEGSNLQTNRIQVFDGATSILRSLEVNSEFKLRFADLIHKHFFNGGVLSVDPDNPTWDPENPEHNPPAARYARLADDIELALIGESARWGDTQSNGVRNDGRLFTLDDWRGVRDQLYTDYFPRRTEIVLQQYIDAGYYPTVAAPSFSQHGGPLVVGTELSIDGPGTVYYTLDGSDPRQSIFSHGVDGANQVASAAEVYQQALQLGQPVTLKARSFVDGQWSALNEASFTVAPPPVRVSELMYHPAGDENAEYIEIVNISDSDPVDLAGMALAEGVRYSFPNAVLAPGERAVVVLNTAAFRAAYGDDIRVLGSYGEADGGRLSNGGERVEFLDAAGAVLQRFTYSDEWYPSTDGNGYSLSVVDVAASVEAWNDAANWRASAARGGSPGADDSAADINGDGTIASDDVDLFCAHFRASDAAADLNGDGTVDRDDLVFLIAGTLRTSFGDTNLDGRFDAADLLAVAAAGRYESDADEPAVWSQGDWNCDGRVDSQDFVFAFQNGRFDGGV